MWSQRKTPSQPAASASRARSTTTAGSANGGMLTMKRISRRSSESARASSLCGAGRERVLAAEAGWPATRLHWHAVHLHAVLGGVLAAVAEHVDEALHSRVG